MKLDEICYRILGRIKNIRFKKKDTNSYFKMYRCYYHKGKGGSRNNLYLTEVVSYGAGVGHQLANWIAGYWFARYFGIKYAYSPFTSSAVPFRPNKWDHILGFGEGEVTAEQLLKSGYKKVQLPYFYEDNEQQVKEIQRIIDSYAGEKVVFFTEANQFYHDQFGVMEDISDKFFNSPARKEDKLIYSENTFNIAIHVRRGDIVKSSKENNPNLTMRYQSNDYFVNALDTALKYIQNKDEKKKDIKIYLFSQGREDDYPEFKKYNNIHFCLDMGAQESFLHMVYADALITSKSSFSYKPALLSRGIKFSPSDFWHGYPKREDWILLDECGNPVSLN